MDLEYVVYNDGLEIGRYADKASATAAVDSYDGEHEVWYEVEEVES